MLERKVLDKIGSLIKSDNNSQYIEEKDLRFIYSNINLTCMIIEALDKNNIRIKKRHSNISIIRDKILEYKNNKSLELRDEITNNCLYYIYKVAHIISLKYSIPMDELISYGYEGLLYGIDIYDEDIGTNLISFLSQNIYYSIIKYIDRGLEKKNNELPIDTISNRESYVIDDILDRISDKQKISFCLDKLSPSYQEIVELYFGFNDYEEHTLNEIGKKMNTSMEMARKKLRKSLVRVKEYYNEIE